jgi:hypothetical protein
MARLPPFTDTSAYPARRPLTAVMEGPNGTEYGEAVEQQCRVAQPNYAALGIDDPEGRN